MLREFWMLSLLISSGQMPGIWPELDATPSVTVRLEGLQYMGQDQAVASTVPHDRGFRDSLGHV